VEIIKGLPDDAIISLYRCGPMVDLCHGPHLPNTGYIKACAVHNVSRAFWRADVTQEPLMVRPPAMSRSSFRAFGVPAADWNFHASTYDSMQRRPLLVCGQLCALGDGESTSNSSIHDNACLRQRVYGITFPDKKQLAEHLERLAEAKKRDHRVVGTQMELFMFDKLSPGSCFFMPNGACIYNALVEVRTTYHHAEAISTCCFVPICRGVDCSRGLG